MDVSHDESEGEDGSDGAAKKDVSPVGKVLERSRADRRRRPPVEVEEEEGLGVSGASPSCWEMEMDRVLLPPPPLLMGAECGGVMVTVCFSGRGDKLAAAGVGVVVAC